MAIGRTRRHEEIHIDIASCDGRPVEQPRALGGQPRQAPPDGLDHAGREATRRLVRPVGLHELRELADEERIPTGAFTHLPGGPGIGTRAGHGGDKCLDLGQGQAGEGHVQSLGAELCQLRCGLALAERADHQHGTDRHCPGEERQ